MTVNKEILSLKQDIEGRLDRLGSAIDEKLHALRDELLATIAANDVRYQQRFDAQSKALDFAAAAAKEAVTAALAGADKAAIKTEQTADKRFADLGDLIREQFKGISDKFDAVAERVTSLETRINESTGEKTGERRTKDDTQQTKDNTGRLLMLVVAVAGWITALATFLFQLKP